MCIIIYKPTGVSIPEETWEEWLKNSSRCNRDGFGYAWRKPGDPWNWRKGVKLQEKHIEEVQGLWGPDVELVLHYRASTGGLLVDENCHPFLVSWDRDPSVVEGTLQDGEVLLFHNGVFRGLSEPPSWSDTRTVADLMRVGAERFAEDTKYAISWLSVVGGHSFLVASNEEVCHNMEVEDNGVWFSNRSYEPWDRRTAGFPYSRWSGFSRKVLLQGDRILEDESGGAGSCNRTVYYGGYWGPEGWWIGGNSRRGGGGSGTE